MLSSEQAGVESGMAKDSPLQERVRAAEEYLTAFDAALAHVY